MNTYIITFYSHFGATRLKKELRKAGTEVQLKPVPRFLSSSCGTCAVLEAGEPVFPSNMNEVEQIVKLTGTGSPDSPDYETLYSAV